MKKAYTLILLSCFLTLAKAQVVQYSGSTIAATTTATNTTNTAITSTAGTFSNQCSPAPYSMRLSSGAFNNATATNYLSFSVKPVSSSYQFSVTSITIDPRRTASGPTNGRIDYNPNNSGWVTGTAFTIGTQTSCPTWTTQTTGTLSGVNITDATNGLQVRIYFWSTGASGNLDYTNVTVNGTVSAGCAAPTVGSASSVNITTTTADLSANITATGGGATITNRGAQYSTSSSLTAPTASDDAGSYTTGSFTRNITGLTPNTPYYYRGYGINNCASPQTGYTDISSFPSFTTLPNAPTSSAASPIAATSFSANWAAPSPAGTATYTYTLEVATDISFSAGYIISTTTGIASGTLTKSITGLTASTSYFYRIKAVNSQGVSVWSAIQSLMTTTPAPEINLKGNGTTIVDGDITPSTTDYTDFSNVGVGISFARVYTIENTGTAVLNISGATITGANAGEFVITAAPASTVAIGGTTTITVTFTPTAAGLRSATLTINNDDADEGVYDFSIQGTGVIGAASTVTAVASSESATISSLKNDATIATTADGVQAWQFSITDDGATPAADALPTVINNIVLTASAGNAIDNFADAIQAIALFDAGGTKLADGVVTSTTITFPGLSYSIADNATATFTIRLSLQTDINTSGTNTSGNLDGDDFGFKIATGAITTDATKSGMLSTTTASSTNSKDVIDVTATQFTFKINASNTAKNNIMAPSVKISPTDINGNIDLSLNGSTVSLTSSGTLTVTPQTANIASGIVTFSNIIHSVIGSNFKLTATSGSITGTSGFFDISATTGTTIVQGDVIIIGINTNMESPASPLPYTGYTPVRFQAGEDEICFFSFKDIITGTTIDMTDNGYERAFAGQWGNTEGTIRLTYSGAATIPAGTPIVLRGNGYSNANFEIKTCGAVDASWAVSSLNGTSTSSSIFNINTTNDQIWIMQGGTWSNPASGTHNSVYSGSVLYGWTGDGWKTNIGTTAPAWTTDGSRMFPKMECFSTDLSSTTNKYKGKYTGPMTSASKFDWVARINTPGNWTTFTDNASYYNCQLNGNDQRFSSNCINFPISTLLGIGGLWTGKKNLDWFDCNNWDILEVPDSTVDVTVNSVTNLPLVDSSSALATYFIGLASSKNLDINSGGSLTLNSNTHNKLLVKGNLTVTGGSFITTAGNVEIRGNYSSTSGSTITPGAATVKFTGTTAQQISNAAGASPLFYNLLINHTGTGVTTNNDVAISNNLTITQGLLDAQTNALTGAATTLTMTGGTLQVGKNAIVQPQLGGAYTLTGGTVILNGNGTGANAQTLRAANYYNLTSASGGDRILPSSGTVGIASVLTPGISVYTVTGSTVDFNGSTAQNIPGLATIASPPANYPYTNQYNVLKTSNAGIKTTTSDFTILDNLTVNSPTVFNLNNIVTLKSDGSITARVAPLASASAITYGTGKFIIERYLPMATPYTSRRWRLLTVPLKSTGAPTINAAWQEGKVSTDRTVPILGTIGSGYGTSITNTTTSSYGFDQGSTNNPSIYCMNAGLWSVPKSTDGTNGGPAAITSYPGYLIFVRGDRSIITSTQYINTSVTNLRAQGLINAGLVSTSLSTTAGQPQIIGNPYPSAISMNAVTMNGTAFGTSGTYYLWDPKLLGSKNVGGFVTFNSNGGGTSATYTVVPYSGGSSGISAYPTTGIIESGEAFMIKSPGAGSININEIDKLTTSSTVGIASRPEPNSFASFYTNLSYVYADSTTAIADGVATLFGDNMHNKIDEQDAPKLRSFTTTEKIWQDRNDSALSIERRQTITDADTIFYNISRLNIPAAYQLDFYGINFDPKLVAVLEDSFTRSSTLINTEKDNYSFKTTADTASVNPTRFKLIFKPIVQYTGLTGKQQNTDVSINWSVANELYVKSYEIERSDNGISFNKIGTTTTSGQLNYQLLDLKPAPGIYYYRIKTIGINNTYSYSNVAKVKMMFTKGQQEMYVFPNPVKDGIISLQFNTQQTGKYSVRLINNLGQVLQTSVLNHAGGTASYTINAAAINTANTYHLEIIGPDKTKTICNFLLSK